MKKKVIAYLHTHWDREWYREFEVFRLRLLRVFDRVLDLLEKGKIPCFYFDGQTAALQDYLELNPEKEKIVRKFIKEKKLFIGPFYTLVDELLTDEICFRKNLEIGLNYAKDMGCEDFIGYFADTFGHSAQVCNILKEFDIDKAVVWRGCPAEIPAEFTFNGINTVNLIRGYFNDIFSSDCDINKKVEFLNKELDLIAQKSSNVLLMPIGADHLGLKTDIAEQINEVNKRLNDYEIILGSPFDYFKSVKNNFKKYEWNKELRNNETTFILPGTYSARTDLKQYSAKCSYSLDLANKFQSFAQKKYKTKSYDKSIEYAYKLLLQNLAHDGICGCSTDLVHRENITRYEKILQIANTIIKEIIYETGEKSLVINLSKNNFTGVLRFDSSNRMLEGEYQEVAKKSGFSDSILYATRKIPITEDYGTIYTYLSYIQDKTPSRLLTKTQKSYGGNYEPSDLKVTPKKIENSKISLTIRGQKFEVTDKVLNKKYSDFITFIDFKDDGDTYNFGPVKDDYGEAGKIISSKVLHKGDTYCALLVQVEIKEMILDIHIGLDRNSHLLTFKVVCDNKKKNHLLQIRFNLLKPITKTFSQCMGELVERDFDPDYDIRKNLPDKKGLEAKTNTAPMQKYVNAQNFEILTKGLFEYEVEKNQLALTLFRATGIISNPKNPARTTPAGPPIEVEDAQMLCKNRLVFMAGFEKPQNWEKSLSKLYPYVITYKE